jgi:uncharacterized protein (DUF111 family)
MKKEIVKHTVTFGIRKMPVELRLLIKRRAFDANVSMEKIILDALTKAIK